MTRAIVFGAAALVSISGCCKEHIEARAFLGHKTLDECAKLLSTAEQPVSIACPGSEVTVCWGSQDVDKVKIAISPDDGQSGDYPKQGAIYLKPFDSTTVKLSGSCTSTTKQIEVLTGKTPVTFDAAWDSKCTSLSYTLDPNFVDPLIKALDVKADWEPVVSSGGHDMTCPTPPFLNGTHLSPLFSFSIQKPNLTNVFSSPQPATGAWGYTLKACDGLGFKCDQNTAAPFDMTLVCPGQ